MATEVLASRLVQIRKGPSMNLTTISQAILTMTSLEISELVESRHDHVRISIERLAERKVITLPPAREVSNTGLGPKTITVYELCKRDSYIVVAQLSPEFTARLVDRWQELENKNTPAVPKTMAQALRLAADQAEQIEAQQLQLEQQKPAVEFVDRFVEAKSAKGFREVAKILGLKEREFIAELAADKVIFKQGSNWLPMADHQHSGRFVVKTGEANGHAFIQCRFTPDGIAWVAKRYSKAA